MPAANTKRKNIRPSASKVQRKVMRYIQLLEQEVEQLKTDPETVIGKLIPQMREAISQNKRLSVLAASLIENGGGRVEISKALLESFDTKVLSIKWELPEGETDPETCSKYFFMYEALTQEEAAARQSQIAVTPEVGESAAVEEQPNEPLPEAVVQLGDSIIAAQVPETAILRDDEEVN
jgi:hypothetical protein